MKDKSIYWKINRINSYDRLFNFVIGGRGIGKTYATKKYCIDNFLKTGEQFIYLRRYKDEIRPLKNNNKFFESLFMLYPDYVFKIKGETAYIGESIIDENDEKENKKEKIDWKVCGYLLNLSTAITKKSVDYSRVTTIIFDEFIIPKGNIRYLNNEVEAFLDFYETVDRMRDKTRVYFLSNAISSFNPYFIYFKIKPPKAGQFLKRKNMVLEMCKQDEFINAKRNTRFGQLIEGTHYASYAIDNEFYLDDEKFIRKKAGNARYFCTLLYKNRKIGIWGDYRNGQFFASFDVDHYCKLEYALTTADHRENALLTKVSKPSQIKAIAKAYSYGLLFFENQEVKGYMLEILEMIA